MRKSSKATPADTGGYLRIGAVERLSGVPAPTIRVWERRYQTLTPTRSARGGRLYSAADVERLALLREVVAAGHAIGSIAALGNDELRALLQPRAPRAAAARAGRVVIVGAGLANRLRPHLPAAGAMQLVASFDALEDPVPMIAPGMADVVLVEVPTIHALEAGLLQRLLEAAQPRLMVVVYGFASHATLRRLDDERVLAVRAPAEAAQLLRLCLLALQLDPRPRVEGGALLERLLLEVPPPRAYSDVQLAELSTAPNTIRCECPRHLADLLTSLVAFERYSAECENRDAEDAAVHALLRRASGVARGLLEQALQHVQRVEGR